MFVSVIHCFFIFSSFVKYLNIEETNQTNILLWVKNSKLNHQKKVLKFPNVKGNILREREKKNPDTMITLLLFVLTKLKEQTQKQKTVLSISLVYNIEDLLSEIVLRGTYRLAVIRVNLYVRRCVTYSWQQCSICQKCSSMFLCVSLARKQTMFSINNTDAE